MILVLSGETAEQNFKRADSQHGAERLISIGHYAARNRLSPGTKDSNAKSRKWRFVLIWDSDRCADWNVA